MLTVADSKKGTDLRNIDWKTVGERYLTAHGMSVDAIAMLEAKQK